MLTSRQRAFLRGRASALETLQIVGRDGVTENVVRGAEELLCARELYKGRVLDGSLLTAAEAAQTLSEACGAEVVCTIGSKYVLYRRNQKLPPEKQIRLP